MWKIGGSAVVVLGCILWGISAQAGSVTVSIVTAAGTTSASVEVSDADLARIMAAEKTGRPHRGTVLPATDQAVVQGIVADAVDTLARRTTMQERSQAVKAATAGIAPVKKIGASPDAPVRPHGGGR